MYGIETGPHPADVGQEKVNGPVMTQAQIELARRKKAIRGFSDSRATDDREVMSQPVFERGQKVRVRRSSGGVEEGWTVTTPLTPEGRVIVSKPSEGGKILEKTVEEEDLVSWNS